MVQTQTLEPDLGTGIYSYAEAASLLQVSYGRVHRWAEGYTAERHGATIHAEPVLYAKRRHAGVLTFPDLIELMFVKLFTDRGVRLATIAATAERLSRELGTPYPFACKRLETDGRQLLDTVGSCFRSVADTQLVFQFVEEFFRNIDFDPDTCLSDRWFPLGRDVPVVIDRHRSFGAPIVATGVRTDIVYATYKAEEGDTEVVAYWYDISPQEVEAAVRFETEWRKAA